MPTCSQWLGYLLRRLIRCNAAGAFARKEPLRWGFVGCLLRRALGTNTYRKKKQEAGSGQRDSLTFDAENLDLE